MHECFISYSTKDKEIAVKIKRYLESNDVPCWIAYRDAVSGLDYAASIVRAIKNAKFFVLILSEHSNTSVHVLNEINSAVNAGKIIIPFKIDEAELSESMEYYLGKTHWIHAFTSPIDVHMEKLMKRITAKEKETKNTVNGFVPASEAKIHRPTDKHQCRMVKYEELLSLGYTSKSISLQLVENDYINCNGIGIENEGTATQWESYLQDNSDTFQYLINGEQLIVGDWSIVALNDESYEMAVNGELLEMDIDLDKTEMICFPGIYNGYILTFSLLPGYRTMENYNLIVRSFLKQLEEYAQQGIYFRSWCMNVFGREVEALIKQLGFKYKIKNKVFGKIYTCDFMPLPKVPLIKKFPKLEQYYAEVEF